MSKQFDLAIYIGRFQPFHLGHLHMLEQCSKLAGATLVLIGSAAEYRSFRNPFLYEERREMVERASVSIRAHVITAPLKDSVSDEARWKAHVVNTVENKVAELKAKFPGIELDKIVLVGHKRDETSWYLDAFPQWPLVSLEDFEGINATSIRKNLLATPAKWPTWRTQSIAKLLPESTLGYLGEVVSSSEAGDVHRVDEFLKDFRDTRPEGITVESIQP